MNEETKAVDTTPTAAQEATVTSTVDATEDIESRIAQLEEAKNKAIEEAANYKLAFLKEKNKTIQNEDFTQDETDEERIRRITREELSRTKIAQIEAEKEALLAKALRENKELKLAHLNKATTTPTAMGSHTETIQVTDTSVTQEQLNAFKARGWSDKDIERYKANLRKNAR